MCGIIGVASTSTVEFRAWLVAGRDAMTHRGPDDAGEWWSHDGRVGLAHRRLSILDLSSLGHQPMLNAGGGLAVIFNGEIYNYAELREELTGFGHAFRSSSDTEILLAAYAQWGDSFLARLNGMFAIALFDSKRQILLLARDRAGEKPLFYRTSDQTLYFASELKALLSDPSAPRRIDPESVDCYLAKGYIPGSRCILQGYSKLPPAHAINFDLRNGKVHKWCYWQLPEMLGQSSLQSFEDTILLDKLEVLLEDAVARQMTADVPVGILLSGGIDSSLVTAMAVRNSDRVRTFSVGFPSHSKFDETPHAQLVANHFGTEHHELLAGPATAELIPRLAHQFDEPIADSSMIPTYLVSQLVRQYCTVALGGDGGDELFAGYPMYQRLMWLRRYAKPIPLSLRKGVSLVANNLMPMGMKGRNFLTSLGCDFEYQIPNFQEIFSFRLRKMLLPQFLPYLGKAEFIRMQRFSGDFDLLQEATRFDFSNYLAEDILVKVDRASMLNSLEIRAPFLDVRLIEFAFGLVPSYLKADPGNKKILLKKLAARTLPPEFDKQRKQGFSIPLCDWLKGGPFRDLFLDTLLSADCLFDRPTVLNLLKAQDQGRDNSERLFSLVIFELWRREFKLIF